jgi:adenylate kinase
VQRADDREETIGRRLEVYRAETAPLIEHYGEIGKLRVVAAEGPFDEVYARLVETLGLAGR